MGQESRRQPGGPGMSSYKSCLLLEEYADEERKRSK